VTAVTIVETLSKRMMRKSASGIRGHTPLPESRRRPTGRSIAIHGIENKNTGIEWRDAPFDTGLTEQEESVMIVF
jgi:hypothetical protein